MNLGSSAPTAYLVYLEPNAGWILDVCETRIRQIVLRIFVVLLGLDMAF